MTPVARDVSPAVGDAMTDREIIEAMLDRAGVKWRTAAYEIEVHVSDQDFSLRVGYADFVAGFAFTEDGALLMVGAWD